MASSSAEDIAGSPAAASMSWRSPAVMLTVFVSPTRKTDSADSAAARTVGIIMEPIKTPATPKTMSFFFNMSKSFQNKKLSASGFYMPNFTCPTYHIIYCLSINND